jgi:pimeloyl-ACP methyl ester carboxylesterase
MMCISLFLTTLAFTECTDACKFQLVKPSDTGSKSSPSSPHYVNAGNITLGKPLRVFLHATGGSAGGYDTLYNSIAGDDCDQPVIGVSYLSHEASDAGRVQACKSAYGNNRSKCLADQHADAIWGGNSQPLLWSNIPEDASVNGRLVLLLVYLDKKHPEQGWSSYLAGGDKVRWDRIVASGHSQGTGHAAWLAQTTPLRGAVLLSGPQDQQHNDTLDDPNFWINAKSWATTRVSAMCHDPEKDSDGTKLSWLRMAGALGWPAGDAPWWNVDAAASPPYGPMTSKLGTGAWGTHGSMSHDPIYAKKIWPGMFDLVSGPSTPPSHM